MDFTAEELHELGDYARHCAYYQEDITPLLPTVQREVLLVATQHGRPAVTLQEGFALIVASWNAVGDLSAQSQARLGEVLAHATYRAEAMEVTHFDQMFDEMVCWKFIHSKVDKLREPSTSTMHLRRSALRAGLTTLRRLGNFEGDPTLDIILPPRSQLAARMATEDEMVLLRMNSVASRASRQPAVLALAETTATTSELPAIEIGAVDDLANPTMVSLPGGKGVRPRTNPLSPWGAKVIRAHIADRLAQGASESEPLIYFGLKPGEASPQASICRALQSIFRRAGLNAEPDLAPRSIGFWAGHEAFEAAPDKKLEVAANIMGIRSLDKAAAHRLQLGGGVSANSVAGPRALGGRTHVLSQIEVAIALLHMPAFHQVAATLPFKKDGEDVNGHRDRGYPKAIVLLLGTMARKCRSLPRAEAFFRSQAMWEVIRTHWRLVKLEGIADSSEPDVLNAKPIRAGQLRYAVEQIKADPSAFPLLERAFLESSVALAVELGHFTRGSISHPHITSCLFADGTELRSQYRSYPDKREDAVTGQLRLAAVDPQIKANGGVRAWLDQDPLTGAWRAVDPKTGERLKKVPVDVDALASGKYGPTQAAYNIVPMSVRDDAEHSRITLTVGADETENTEAATILAAVERIDGTCLGGKVQALMTDMIIRGAHGVTLMTRYGIVPLTKVAAAAVEDGTPEGPQAIDVIVFTGRDGVTRTKTAKTYSLGMRSHTLASGVECKHIFHRVDGAMIEVDFNQDGTEFIEVGRPEQFQVKRSGRVTNGRRYHFNEGFHVTCPHGNFDIWCCPHESHGDDDGRHVAENSRIFPEGGAIFRGLYGAGRNTSEGGNAHHKDTYPHKRSQASGRVPVLLDAYLYYLIDNATNYLIDNATTWYFQVGWVSVDEVLPQPVDTIIQLAA